MKQETKAPRLDLVQRARARKKECAYDLPEVLALTAERVHKTLLFNLDSCPIGDGNRYRDCVKECCQHIWDGVFDVGRTRAERGNRGARIDIEFPLRLEALGEFPLFSQWAEWYGIRSVLAEVKNEKRAAAVEDAKQIVGDLAVARRGKFGLLIARNGITRSAFRYLSELARTQEYLVLPLSHDDMCKLLHAHSSKSMMAMEFLRVRQDELLQAA